MRLSPDQLPSALQRGIKPVYLVSGDEPLTVGECADAIRAAARAAGYADRTVFFIERGFSWDELHHATQALSLFADRRLFELRMPSGKPDKGAQVLLDIANEPPPDVLTLIVTDKLDRKASEAAWVRAIEKQGAWIPVWPVSADSLPSWLERRAAILGLTLEAPAARIIVERVEGNLLAAKQELEILALLAEGGVIGESLVMRTVGDSARYDVFQLAAAREPNPPSFYGRWCVNCAVSGRRESAIAPARTAAADGIRRQSLRRAPSGDWGKCRWRRCCRKRRARIAPSRASCREILGPASSP